MECPINLGRERKAFSLFFAQEPAPASVCSVLPCVLCRKDAGGNLMDLEGIWRIWRESDGQGSHKEERRMSSKTMSPAFLLAIQNLHKATSPRGSRCLQQPDSQVVLKALQDPSTPLWTATLGFKGVHWLDWERDFSRAVLHKQSFSLPQPSNSWNPVFFITLPRMIPSSINFCFIALTPSLCHSLPLTLYRLSSLR